MSKITLTKKEVQTLIGLLQDNEDTDYQLVIKQTATSGIGNTTYIHVKGNKEETHTNITDYDSW